MRQMSDLVRDQKPLTMLPTASVQEACSRMRERRVGAVLVVDADRRLVGIFTGRDAVAKVGAEGGDPSKKTLATVMTRRPTTCGPSCTAIEALRLMQDCRIRHLPIVEDGRLLGIVSRGDFRGVERDRLDEETGFWERI